MKEETNNRLAALVIRLQSGDAEAFNEFYEETHKFISSCAYKICGRTELTNDIVQDTYERICMAMAQLENPEAVWGWLKTTTVRSALSAVRKENKYILMADEESETVFSRMEEVDPSKLPEKAYECMEADEIRRSLIQRLPEKQRLAVWEREINDRKVADIAAMYGWSVGTVKHYLSIGRRKMKEMYMEDREEIYAA